MTSHFANLHTRSIAALAGSLCAMCGALVGCDRAPGPASSSERPTHAAPVPEAKRPLRVAVTLPPLAGLVKPMLREGDELTVLLSPGKSEHGFEFTPKELASLGRADMIVYVGLGLEPQVERFLSRGGSHREILALSRELKLEPPADPTSNEHALHEHAGHDEPSHTESHAHAIDPHLWLDPELVRQSIPGIRSAVERAYTAAGIAPDSARVASAESKLLADVAQLDLEYRTRLKPFEGRSIVTHHAAFNRLASRYGLRIAEVIRPIESSEPTPGQLAEVVAAIKQQNVQVIFVEPQFNADAARRIAQAAGVRVGTLDPLGDGDWFAMMRRNLDELVAKLGGT